MTFKKATIFLQSIKREDPRYGEALRALARLGTIEWAESLKETDEYTDDIRKKKRKSMKEFYQIFFSITESNNM